MARKKTDYKSLLKNTSLQNRRRLARTQAGQSLMAALTPAEMAELFPFYFRKGLPDMGLKPTEKDGGGSGGSSGGGGSGGTAEATGAYYGGAGRRYSGGGGSSGVKGGGNTARPTGKPPEPEAKLTATEQQALTRLKNGAPVKASDPEFKFLEKLPPEKLKEVGVSTLKPLAGETQYVYNKPKSKYAEMSVEDARKQMGGSGRSAAITKAANEIGVAPKDLATIISYESGGTFSTSKWGGTGGNYLGLIQFGPAERKKYGVHPNQSFEEQMSSAKRFLEDRGLKKWLAENPNASEMDKRTALYSTINAGSPGEKYWSRSDRPGFTVRTHVENMFNDKKGHVAKGSAFLENNSLPSNATDEQVKEWLDKKNKEDVQTQEAAREKGLAKGLRGTESTYGGQRPSASPTAAPSFGEGEFEDASSAKSYLRTVSTIGDSARIMREHGYDSIANMNDKTAVGFANAIRAYNASAAEKGGPKAGLTSATRFPLRGMPGGMNNKEHSLHAGGMAGDLVFYGKNGQLPLNEGPHDAFAPFAEKAGLYQGRNIYGKHETHHYQSYPGKSNPYAKMFDASGKPTDPDLLRSVDPLTGQRWVSPAERRQQASTQNQNNASAKQEQDKGTMLYMPGMHSRYGDTKPEDIENQAREYAKVKGYKFESIGVSGDDKKAQREAMMERIKKGGVTGLYGFSAGAESVEYANRKMSKEQREAIKHAAIVGRYKGGSKVGDWDTAIQNDPEKGGHMAGPATLLDKAQKDAADLAKSDVVPADSIVPKLGTNNADIKPKTPPAPSDVVPKDGITKAKESNPDAWKALDEINKETKKNGLTGTDSKMAQGGEIPFRDDESLKASPMDNTRITSDKNGKGYQINPNRETVRANLQKKVLEVTPDYKLQKNERADRGDGKGPIQPDAKPDKSDQPSPNTGRMSQGMSRNAMPPGWNEQHISVQPGSVSSARAYRQALHFTDGPHHNYGGPWNIVA